MILGLKWRGYITQYACAIKVGFVRVSVIYYGQKLWIIECQKIGRDAYDRALEGIERLAISQLVVLKEKCTIYIVKLNASCVRLLGHADIKLPEV